MSLFGTSGDLVGFAARALVGHRVRSLLSLLGVAVGVAAVIVLTSLGEGARRYVTGEFESLGTNLLIVLPGKVETTGAAPVMGGVPNDLTLGDAEAIERRVPAVKLVAPLALGTARMSFGERSRDATVVGTSPSMLPVRKLSIMTGRYLPEGSGNRRVCVIGTKLQRELFREENPLGEVVRIGEERFRVIGVMAPRGMSLGMDMDEVVHVPAERALRLFNRTSLFRILVEVRATDAIQSAKREILELVRERHNGDDDITLITQDSVVSTFGRILAALTAALAGIAAISLSVAGIGIMNVMLVSVSERTREIGLLKALGVSPGQVLWVFLIEASLLSSLGGLLGLATGYGAAAALVWVYPAFPAQPPGWAVASAIVVSFAVGTLFGALPARRASRLDPVLALAGR